jgi:transcription antitermination protein NusB
VKKDWRRRGREAALQILYQWDLSRADIDVTIGTFFDLQWPDRQPPPEALRAFAASLARDTVAGLEEIDGLIAGAAQNWRPERMAVLDRLVLRMAICELLRHNPETPPPVVINEAIELARTFSTEDAVKFINGMLDGIKRKIEK